MIVLIIKLFKRIILLLFPLLFFISSYVSAQNQTIDSLSALLQKHVIQDTLRVNLLNDIAENFSAIQNERLLHYATQADSLSDVIGFSKGKVKSLNLIGLFYWLVSDYQKALEIHEKALSIAESTLDEHGKSECFYYIGNVYREKSDFSKALHYYQKSNEIKGRIGDLAGMANIYNCFGMVFRIQGDYARALEYSQKALIIKEEVGDRTGLSTIYNNIGNVYYYQNNYPKALEFYHKSLEIAEEKGNKTGIVTCYNNIGIVYFYQNDYLKALDYFERSLVIQKEIEDKTGYAISYINIGEIFTKQKEYDRAWEHYTKGLTLSIEIGIKSVEGWSYWGLSQISMHQHKYREAYENSKKAYVVGNEIGEIELIQRSSKILSTSSAALGLYKEAYDFQLVYKEMSDSIINDANTRRLIGLEYEYKYEKAKVEQEKREAEQRVKYQRQRYLTLTFVISFGLMLMLAIVIFRNYKQKKKDIQTITEQKTEIELKNTALEQNKEEIKAQNISLQQANAELNASNEKINTQKKLLEEQAIKLRQLDEIKSRFFTNISHEFRTPLTLILGPTEQLLAQTNDSKVKSSLKLVQHNAKNLLGLINQLLDISRIEKGMVKMKLTEGDIVKELFFITNVFDSQAASKGVKLQFSSEFETYHGYFDKEKLERILYNLLSNAIKNTSQGSVKVSLEKSLTLSYIRIVVADTGKGIEKEKLPFIFDRFYMADSTDKIGSGIGLAFINELVKVYRGNINVTSELGEGTTFYVELPCSKEAFTDDEYEILEPFEVESKSVELPPEIARIDSESTLDEKSKQAQKTILIVEDHEELRKFIAENLCENFRVLEAENGKKGIDLAFSNMPDLVVTDVMMPEVSGIELTKTLKNSNETSHIPIIILTAKASEENRIEGLETEADDYLTKPFSIKELSVRIQNLLRIRQKLREKYIRSIEVNPSEITTNSVDEQFVSRILKVVEENMADPDFSVETLCDLAGVSRATLHKKLKSLVEQSATEFINTIRVKRAAQLIKQKAGNISEVAYDVGFNNLSYFTKVFKKYIGVAPSEMME